MNRSPPSRLDLEQQAVNNEVVIGQRRVDLAQERIAPCVIFVPLPSENLEFLPLTRRSLEKHIQVKVFGERWASGLGLSVKPIEPANTALRRRKLGQLIAAENGLAPA